MKVSILRVQHGWITNLSKTCFRYDPVSPFVQAGCMWLEVEKKGW